jgi:serine/threonine/tyrosine-interacting protein
VSVALDCIVNGLFLGTRQEALDSTLPEWAGVTAVLTVYESDGAPDAFPPGVNALQLHVRDGRPVPAEVLRRSTHFIREQRAAGGKVLVACGLGISRSPTFVAAYLHEEGADLRDALRVIIAARRQVFPHPALLQSVIDCYGAPVTLSDLLADVRHAKRGSPWTG